MARVFEGGRTILPPVVAPIEKGIYRLVGVKSDEEQDWKVYTLSFITFRLEGTLLLSLGRQT